MEGEPRLEEELFLKLEPDSLKEKVEVEKMTLKTEIPDQSIVLNRASLRDQGIFIDFNELEDYFDWIEGQAKDKVVSRAILLTKNNLSEENHEKWDELSQRDEVYSLGQCIDEKVCTCFHRGIFLTL